MKQLYIEKAREMRSRRWVISRWNLRPGDEVEKWPVLASRAPEPESWMLTGRGSVGVIRRKPDNSAVGFIANLSLERGGIFEYGFLDGIPAGIDYEEYLEGALRDSVFYPSMEAPADWAARYFWDAAAFGSELPLPPPAPERMLFRMLPPSAEFMQKTMAGAKGLPSTVPQELAEIVKQVIEQGGFDPDGLPIYGEAFFRVDNPSRLFRIMRKSPIFTKRVTPTGLKGCVKSPTMRNASGEKVSVFEDGLGSFALSHDQLTIRTGPLAALGALYLIMKAAARGGLQLIHSRYRPAPKDFTDLLNAA